MLQWLTKLEPVHRAETREEKEAVYRFRYSIYVEEYGRELGKYEDGDRKWVYDAEDEKDYTTIFYAGSVDDVQGTVRVRHWEPGEVPDYDLQELSMDLIPDLAERRTSEIGRFMIRRSLRSRLLLAAFANVTYDFLAGEKLTDLNFCYCAPGLVHYYRKLGARPFGGRIVHTPDGMMVPLVSVLSDIDYFRQAGSPLAPRVRRHFGRGKREPIDLAPYRHLFEEERRALEVDTEKAWGELQDVFTEESEELPSFIDALEPEVKKRLVRDGFLMDVPAEMLVARKGYSEREMYVVLDGLFEVFDGERRLRVLGKGEIIGEIGFFRHSGQRSASVRALTDGRVLVVRGASLEKMIEKDPTTAARILLGIGGVMAERLASINEVQEDEEA